MSILLGTGGAETTTVAQRPQLAAGSPGRMCFSNLRAGILGTSCGPGAMDANQADCEWGTAGPLDENQELFLWTLGQASPMYATEEMLSH